jgi:hypothetical protein
MKVTVTKSAISTNIPSVMGKYKRHADEKVNHKIKFQ